MTTYKITGMTCGHCARAVEKALQQVPGVTKVVKVDVAAGEATIEGTPADDQVLLAVQREGYKAARAE